MLVRGKLKPSLQQGRSLGATKELSKHEEATTNPNKDSLHTMKNARKLHLFSIHFISQNSWGKSFGEDGYFKIQSGTGHCGFGWQLNNVPLC